LYLGTCQLGVAYVFFSRAVPQVRAIEVSLLLLLEPVLNPLWAWLVHGETPGPYPCWRRDHLAARAQHVVVGARATARSGALMPTPRFRFAIFFSRS